MIQSEQSVNSVILLNLTFFDRIVETYALTRQLMENEKNEINQILKNLFPLTPSKSEIEESNICDLIETYLQDKSLLKESSYEHIEIMTLYQ
jgi:hypothetical protein